MQQDYSQQAPEEQLEKAADRIRRLQSENRKLRAASKKKRAEFSKIIFVGVSVATLALSVFSCYMVWTTKDTTPLVYLIPAMFAELASATGFYFTKAKAENKIKLMRLYGVQPDSESFKEN